MLYAQWSNLNGLFLNNYFSNFIFLGSKPLLQICHQNNNMHNFDINFF